MIRVMLEADESQDENLSMWLALMSKAGIKAKGTNYGDVMAFHYQFKVPTANTPSLLSQDTLEFRTKFLEEELKEFIEGACQEDLVQMGDALIDLVYVAMGTAHMMGLPWQKMWDEVQRANITKVRATSAEQSKRGSALDVIKPMGWVGPNHCQYIGDGPWPTL